MNEKIDLRVTLLNKNFEKKIKICSQIRILNKKKLKKELNKFNLKEEADILKNHRVDGLKFINLFSQNDGLYLFENHMGFTSTQIKNLKKFYFEISQFRFFFSRDFNISEIPCYVL